MNKGGNRVVVEQSPRQLPQSPAEDVIVKMDLSNYSQVAASKVDSYQTLIHQVDSYQALIHQVDSYQAFIHQVDNDQAFIHQVDNDQALIQQGRQ